MEISTTPPVPAPIPVDAGAPVRIRAIMATQIRRQHHHVVVTATTAAPPMVGTMDHGLTHVERIITTTVAAPVAVRRATRHPPRSRMVTRRADRQTPIIRHQAGAIAGVATHLPRMPAAHKIARIQPPAIRLHHEAIHSLSRITRNRVTLLQVVVATAHQVRRATVHRVTVRLVTHQVAVAEEAPVAVVAVAVAHGRLYC